MNSKNKDIKEGKKVMPTFEKNTMAFSRDWFKDWMNSPYYHQLYASRDEKESPFIGRLLNFLEPPAGSFLLDSACGAGRHALRLAESGYDVTGIDLSFRAIDEAKQWETERLHFFQHDLRLPFWMNYFHVAFAFSDGFGFYKSKREHSNAVRTIAHSLRPGGQFVLDYLNAPYAGGHLSADTDMVIDGTHFYLARWQDETHFYKKIIVEDGQSDRPLTYEERLAKFSLEDLSDIFSMHHLQVREVFGDYDLNAYDVQHSPRLIVVAKKVSGE